MTFEISLVIYLLFCFRMSSFISACETHLEQRRNRRLANRVIQPYRPDIRFGYLMPLRCSKALIGPMKIILSENTVFTVGRERYCCLVLPEDMFEVEENRKHDKEWFYMWILIRDTPAHFRILEHIQALGNEAQYFRYLCRVHAISGLIREMRYFRHSMHLIEHLIPRLSPESAQASADVKSKV